MEKRKEKLDSVIEFSIADSLLIRRITGRYKPFHGGVGEATTWFLFYMARNIRAGLRAVHPLQSFGFCCC